MAETDPTPTAPAWVRLAAYLVPRLPAGRYRASAWLGRRARGMFWMRLRPSAGRLWFRCDPRDQIARDVCFTGVYEPQETILVSAILAAGMTFVDVGANWGYFSLLGAHRVGEHGRVIGLEPDPRLFAILEANLRRNGLSQVLPMRLAAAEAAGTLDLTGYQERGGNWGVSRITGGDAGNGPNFRVASEALDHVLEDLKVGEVDLLKMDIEGAEGRALAGLKHHLTDHRIRRLLLEIHPDQLKEQGHSAEQVLATLRGAGYQGWVIDHSREATRRGSYNRSAPPQSFLAPLTVTSKADDWPHYLWLAPGVAPPLSPA